MNGWTIAKYALALAGLALVIGADRIGQRWVGYVGLALLGCAFALRFVKRGRERRSEGEAE